ncbi:Geminin homolog [Caenorhabditis elegans]|uniref:Geminin homolog n=1 Tax=Caenorhabditis elegans TaxID=6239 RepID=GEMI_CAEEL|nr:Geminin homolog [Caenorhabditis elegans]G5EEM1.1 RecName: Full=Geminin homolog [Caenorhabditis elegans]BAD98298.1 geminin homolog [Caenorhabditis elegans]CAA22084.1 Geminin homolog [Caenorhabditis elegans]|eukprot:NP_499589.1 GeMiNin homolog [Caenorhabditis elegans]
MSRIGLQQLNNSARNSPFGSEKATGTKQIPEPLKLTAQLKKYQPITPSPLASATTITPVLSPFDVFCDDDQEAKNVETQMFEYGTVSTQTIINVPHVQPKITEADLTSEKPTVNYLRVMADRLQMDLDDEMDRNQRLVAELGDLDEKMRKIDDDTEILLEVLADIDEEQQTDEEIGTAQL